VKGMKSAEDNHSAFGDGRRQAKELKQIAARPAARPFKDFSFSLTVQEKLNDFL